MPARDVENTLSPVARAILARFDARWGGESGDRPALTALLRNCGYEPHEPALVFEERYGGLVIFADKAQPALVVGPYSCLLSGFSRYPNGGAENAAHQLIPVILGWDDMIYYLGADGRGWVEWTDCVRTIAGDARQLMTRALLWRLLLSTEAAFESGEHGAALARDRGLPPIDDAFGGEQWWGTPESVVVQFDHPSMGPCTYSTVR